MFSQQREAVQNGDEGDRGALLLEYGLILVLIVIVAMVGLTAFGGAVLELYTENASKFAAAIDGVLG